jgi:CubicO group peptidase (beta-lactamase class C family)
MRVPAVLIRFLGPVVALAVAALVLTPMSASGMVPPDAAHRATATAGCRQASLPSTASCTGREPGQAAHIIALARAAMKRDDLHAVILSVWEGHRQIARAALGQSITSQPATTRMHFRIGAIAIPYLAILLLRLVDQKRVSLDDRLARWYPTLPHARQITLAQLTMAYLPSKKVAIAVATTLGPKASSSTNYSTQLTAAVGKYLVPQRPPFP